MASAAQVHVSRVFRQTFNPQALVRELWRSAPEMMDLVSQLPRLIGAGFRAADQTLSGKPRPNPLAGLHGAIVSGACLIAAAVVVVQHGPLVLSVGLWRTRVAPRWVPALVGAFILVEFAGSAVTQWSFQVAAVLYLIAFVALARVVRATPAASWESGQPAAGSSGAISAVSEIESPSAVST